MFALRSTGISAKEALRLGVMRLQRAKIESASLDARLLLEEVMGASREQFLGMSETKLTPAQESDYWDWIEQRSKRKPVSQLIGRREFWGMDFRVTQATLDPRPDSETLIEAMLEWVRSQEVKGLKSWVEGQYEKSMTLDSRPMTILDLGTGTGCLLLSLLSELPRASGVGVDQSEEALSVAKENAAHNGLEHRVEFRVSDWCKNVEESFDMVIANPPYIPTAEIAALAPEVAMYEPKRALDGGADGLECYREIFAQLPRVMKPNAIAAFEIGMGQQEAVEKIMADCAFRVVGVKQDLHGIARCLLVQPH